MKEDWLDVGATGVSAEQKAVANDEAKLYFATFVSNPAGAELLKRWTERDFNEPVPVDASVQRYAAVEARRGFIRGIHRWVEIAKKGIE